MFENVRRDLVRACRANQGQQVGLLPVLRELWNPGTQAILTHRFGFWGDNVGIPGVRHLLRVIHFVLQYFFAWRVGIFIPVKARIGPGMVIHTWGGGIFLPSAPIGRDLTIIGGGVQLDYDTREIGSEVMLGPGTKGIGKIRIGDRVRTGPNSVVQEDVADDCVVFGNPGRIIGPIPKAPAFVRTTSSPPSDSPLAEVIGA
jgi:serine O-acetyltransferase